MMTTDPAPSGAAEAGTHRPGRPAEQVIADAISSVLVVPAETLAPLAERVADALGLPWPSGAGEAGPVLGDKARARLVAARLPSSIERMSDGYLSVCQRSEEEAADLALAVLAPHVAALVAAAEERGAAAERERIAVACEAEARKWAQPWDFRPAESAIAYERAAAIAREQS